MLCGLINVYQYTVTIFNHTLLVTLKLAIDVNMLIVFSDQQFKNTDKYI